MRQGFRFCDLCVRKADEETRVDICDSCFQSRRKFLSHIKKDAAYRSHISRQLAGIPCDASSACPHHKESEPTISFKDLDGKQAREVEVAVGHSWYRVARYSYEKIAALELLAGHHLELIEYCGSCYSKALDNDYLLDYLTINPEHSSLTVNSERYFHIDVELCGECLEKRDTFIQFNHRYQGAFKEPWQRERSPRLVVCTEILDRHKGLEVDFDTYHDYYRFDQIGGGSWDTSNTIAIAIGVPSAGVTIASFVYRLVKDYRERKEKSANRDVESGYTDDGIELAPVTHEPASISQQITGPHIPPVAHLAPQNHNAVVNAPAMTEMVTDAAETATVSSYHTALSTEVPGA